MTRDELLTQLWQLLPSQFDEVLSRARIPLQLLSGPSAPQTVRAIEAVRYVEQQQKLEELAQVLGNVLGAGPAIGSLSGARLAPALEPQPALLLGISQLSPKFVTRSTIQAKLEQLLRAPAGPVGKMIVLHGGAGSGKSSLAAWLAYNELWRELFADGVLASECGQSPDVRRILSTWGRKLGDRELDVNGYLDRETGRDSLRALLHDRACLLVVDDVWNVDIVRDWFRVGGRRCALLVTTRIGEIAAEIGADLVSVGGLEQAEARQLLEHWTRSTPPDDPDAIDAIVNEVDALPLALELIGAEVNRLGSWNKFIDRWERATGLRLDLLRRGPSGTGRHNSVRCSIELSIDALDELSSELLALSVFPEKAEISESPAAALWACPIDTAFDRLTIFSSRALIHRRESPVGPVFVFHDLVRELIVQRSELPRLHCRLVTGYGTRCNGRWHELHDDGYVWEHLAYHMRYAGDVNGLRVLLDDRWLTLRRGTTDSWWTVASDLDHALATQGASVADRFQWSYRRAALGARAAEIPRAALAALVRIGELDRARAMAGLISDHRRRIAAWLEMATAALAIGDVRTAHQLALSSRDALSSFGDRAGRVELFDELFRLADTLAARPLQDECALMLQQEAMTVQNELFTYRAFAAAVPALIVVGRVELARRLLSFARVAESHAQGKRGALGAVWQLRLRQCYALLGESIEAEACDAKYRAAMEEVDFQSPQPHYENLLIEALAEVGELDPSSKALRTCLDRWAGTRASATIASQMLRSEPRRAHALVADALRACPLGATDTWTIPYDHEEAESALTALIDIAVRSENIDNARALSGRRVTLRLRAVVSAALASALAATGADLGSVRDYIEAAFREGQARNDSHAHAWTVASVGARLARLAAQEDALAVLDHGIEKLSADQADPRSWPWAATKAIEASIDGYARIGALESVHRVLDLAASAREYDVPWLADHAIALLDRNRPDEASTWLENLLQRVWKEPPAEAYWKEPSADAYLLAASSHVQLRLGDTARALAEARVAVDVVGRAGHPLGTTERGNLRNAIQLAAATCAMLGPFTEAMQLLELLHPLADGNTDLIIPTRMIEALWQMKAFDMALEVAKRSLDPGAPSALLALAYERAGLTSEATTLAKGLVASWREGAL